MMVPITPTALSLRQLERHMEHAGALNEWQQLAQDHDRLSGGRRWRERDDTYLYDFAEIRCRLTELRQLLAQENHTELLYALNQGIHGNMAGMGRALLYTHAKTGTKRLIDDYVSTTVEALRFIADARESKVPLEEKVDFFRRASHCYGRTALMLSGGAGLIYFHHGVVQTLIDENLLPNVISGSSAGAWVASLIGTHTDEELKAGYFDRYRYDIRDDVTPLEALFSRNPALAPLAVKDRALDGIDTRMTFKEAYELTGRYINVSIAPMEKHQHSRLMNAITSPHVYIRSAIDASSSIPGVFPPVTLYAKGTDGMPKPYLPSRKWVDGSTADDLPAKRLARLFGVNHYMVSLINPITAPFVSDPKSRMHDGVHHIAAQLGVTVTKDVLNLIENTLFRYGANRLSGAFLMMHSVLNQKYTGDINMILHLSDFRLRQIFHFFGPGEIEELILLGKRSVWPKLSMIRNTTLIGRELDKILEQLDQRELSQGRALTRHLVAAT